MSFVDQGDSLWLVWKEGRKAAQLYPCAVTMIGRSSPDMTTVHLDFYQDNGSYAEPSEIMLSIRARFDESAMRSPSRAHLDWGVRISVTQLSV